MNARRKRRRDLERWRKRTRGLWLWRFVFYSKEIPLSAWYMTANHATFDWSCSSLEAKVKPTQEIHRG